VQLELLEHVKARIANTDDEPFAFECYILCYVLRHQRGSSRADCFIACSIADSLPIANHHF
jgi:hypothetical protein